MGILWAAGPRGLKGFFWLGLSNWFGILVGGVELTKNKSIEKGDLRVQTLLWLFALVFLVVFLGLPPIPQDQAYHTFADEGDWWIIDNAFNVLSNLPYFLVGYLGWKSVV